VRKALQVRGPRVVGVERLHDSGARDPRDVPEEDDDERECRERQVLDLGEDARAGIGLGSHGQPAEPDREHEDEHEPGHDLGHDGER
jgi:hypothetical protein